MMTGAQTRGRPRAIRAFVLWFTVLTALFLTACSTPPSLAEREGFIEVTGGRVWYRIVGSGGATPVVVLHGGPGAASDYLKPLEKLAVDRPVIFYDQLGCGRSDRPTDRTLWRIERFVEELAQVREALKLKEIHLYGHSWGTMLVVDYMLTKPFGVKSLILSSPCLSAKRWVEDADVLIAQLPPDTQKVIRHHEKEGTTDSKEYDDAVTEYLKRHLCRLDPWPEDLTRSLASSNAEIYKKMWGPSEFHPTGDLRTYDRVDRLREITVPTLFTAGRYDEATPGATTWYSSHLPGSTVRIFQKSSHMAMFEEQEEYMRTLREFMRQF
ncbi:MAG TPA: proline iminopeptidase-family hydrolase [Syntrophorhabdaceae bacterium]|nr:proline iminopeptidase-family hydrolase [Syntrophorhabdaceae bacterium]